MDEERRLKEAAVVAAVTLLSYNNFNSIQPLCFHPALRSIMKSMCLSHQGRMVTVLLLHFSQNGFDLDPHLHLLNPDRWPVTSALCPRIIVCPTFRRRLSEQLLVSVLIHHSGREGPTLCSLFHSIFFSPSSSFLYCNFGFLFLENKISLAVGILLFGPHASRPMFNYSCCTTHSPQLWEAITHTHTHTHLHHTHTHQVSVNACTACWQWYFGGFVLGKGTGSFCV